MRCVTRGVRSNIFFVGVDKTSSRGFILRHYFLPVILHFSKCWCFLLIRISLKTARHATTLGFQWRDRCGVHDRPSLGALRAVCRVSRVHVPCVMRCFPPPPKKKGAAGPNGLGEPFEDASLSPGKRFLFFPHLYFKGWSFLL